MPHHQSKYASDVVIVQDYYRPSSSSSSSSAGRSSYESSRSSSTSMDSRASQYTQYSNSSTSSGPPARDGAYRDPKSSGNYVDVVQRKGPKGVVVVINHHMANPDPNEPRSSDCR